MDKIQRQGCKGIILFNGAYYIVRGGQLLRKNSTFPSYGTDINISK
jgi:hypothetical protein